MNESSTPDAGNPAEDATVYDQELAELLSLAEDVLRRGEPRELEELCQQHPEYAEELRLLLATARVADMAGDQYRQESQAEKATSFSMELSLPCCLGDYELIEEIGRGGMGVVFRARQLSLDREVAVKMISRGPLASEQERTRFQAEAMAVAQLDHPAIVPVYDVGEMDSRPFFSMKLIEGETLAQRISKAPLSSEEAVELIVQVCLAVEYAHLNGILHRDLKPSNILIDENGQAHVRDFGLAKRIDDSSDITRSGAVLGTPAYMAPEQAAGQRGEVSAASDVYSLGSVLYSALTGRPPFQAATAVDTLLLVLEQEPLPPRALNPGIDRDLEMIVLRCLQKPVDLRYSSAAELARDLQAYLDDESISARSGRFAHVVARWLKETHHATVLEKWGLLWMWHSLVLLLICLVTNLLYLQKVESRWIYFILWTVGLGAWAVVFWSIRRRMGPVLFVERQIAHVWASSMVAIAALFPVEYLLGLPVLKLAPVLALVSGMVFTVKAGVLTGKFYTQAIAMFAMAPLMAIFPDWALGIFGVSGAVCFLVPGWKYHRQSSDRAADRRRTDQP
ncbi:MAG: serine/threonine-protein kinase [Pirellulaceae bacterium]